MGARRILVLTAAFVLVFLSVAAGFLFHGETSSRSLVVDLRTRPTAAEVTAKLGENQTATPPIIIATPYQINTSCIVTVPARPLGKNDYCDAFKRGPITLITDETRKEPPELLREIYGTEYEIQGDGAFRESVKTTSTGFKPVAALVTFGVTAIVLAAGWITIRVKRSSPSRVPAMREAVPANRQRAPLPQPQMAGARSGGSPPPRQPARSPQPIRGIASELTPLVTRANRRAIARTHINSHGGYVSVGDVVVWAVLPPTEEGVVVPDDELDILGVDERAETLVVAPAGSPSSGRRPRP